MQINSVITDYDFTKIIKTADEHMVFDWPDKKEYNDPKLLIREMLVQLLSACGVHLNCTETYEYADVLNMSFKFDTFAKAQTFDAEFKKINNIWEALAFMLNEEFKFDVRAIDPGTADDYKALLDHVEKHMLKRGYIFEYTMQRWFDETAYTHTDTYQIYFNKEGVNNG